MLTEGKRGSTANVVSGMIAEASKGSVTSRTCSSCHNLSNSFCQRSFSTIWKYHDILYWITELFSSLFLYILNLWIDAICDLKFLFFFFFGNVSNVKLSYNLQSSEKNSSGPYLQHYFSSFNKMKLKLGLHSNISMIIIRKVT